MRLNEGLQEKTDGLDTETRPTAARVAEERVSLQEEAGGNGCSPRGGRDHGKHGFSYHADPIRQRHLPTRTTRHTMPPNGLEAVYLDNRDKLLRFLRARGAGEAAEDLIHDLWLKVVGRSDGPIANPVAYGGTMPGTKDSRIIRRQPRPRNARSARGRRLRRSRSSCKRSAIARRRSSIERVSKGYHNVSSLRSSASA
jgi:hypothetical protein